MAETQRPNRREQELSGERTSLESFLDDYRDIVVRKVSGLSDTDARRRLVASSTTVGGLTKHLRWAEYGWFDQLLQERSNDNRRTHDRSWEFEFLPEESLPTLITEYQTQLRGIPADRRAVSPRSRGAASPLRDRIAALDLRAHDRGDRPAHRATRHPARATRRRNRVRRLRRPRPPG